MRPVEGRCLLDVVVDEPNLLEHQKATLIVDKQKEACELNEMDSEVINVLRCIVDLFFLTVCTQPCWNIVIIF